MYVKLGGKACCIVKPEAEVPLGRVLEDDHTQHNRSLQHDQWIAFSAEIVQKLCLAKE